MHNLKSYLLATVVVVSLVASLALNTVKQTIPQLQPLPLLRPISIRAELICLVPRMAPARSNVTLPKLMVPG
jgi:flagellar biosynthesis protein FliR